MTNGQTQEELTLEKLSKLSNQEINNLIGQTLYSIALVSSSINCNCETCKLARRLGLLLAEQLKRVPQV
ncbi:MAG: hypothetical protein LM587_02675 [Candidatus Aenigmarchaeota archaeon]|nr:hypothetical protein [Candidatus Aenigmarchaeota archaeon]